MTAPVVVARGLRKAYGDVTVLDGVDLDVGRGEVLALLGPLALAEDVLLGLRQVALAAFGVLPASELVTLGVPRGLLPVLLGLLLLAPGEALGLLAVAAQRLGLPACVLVLLLVHGTSLDG